MTIATEELRKLVNDATPGPWEARSSRQGCWVSADCDPWTVVGTEDDEGRYGAIKIDANAVLIALTPTLAAELITARAKLETAEKIKAAYEELLATVQGECPSLVNEDSGGSQVLINCVLDAEEAIAAWEALK